MKSLFGKNRVSEAENQVHRLKGFEIQLFGAFLIRLAKFCDGWGVLGSAFPTFVSDWRRPVIHKEF